MMDNKAGICWNNCDHKKQAIMEKKTRKDRNVHPSRKGVLVCTIFVYLSFFTVTSADGIAKSNTFREIPSSMMKITDLTSTCNALTIRSHQASGESKYHAISGPYFISLRGGAAAIKLLPSG